MNREDAMRNVPQLQLEKMVLGETRRDPAQAEALAALERDNEAILAALPPDVVARQIEAKLTSGRRRTSTVRWAAPLAVAASLLLMLFWPKPQTDDILLKGDGPHLMIYRKTAADYERLKPGATAKTGDLLQIRYVAAGKRYGVIVSVDGRGGATLHFPTKPDGSTALTPSGEIALAFAYQLDDAPAFERFLFVTSDEPLDARSVLDGARRLAAGRDAATGGLDLSQNTLQFSFMMRK